MKENIANNFLLYVTKFDYRKKNKISSHKFKIKSVLIFTILNLQMRTARQNIAVQKQILKQTQGKM